MKFLIGNYTNSQTFLEIKVKPLHSCKLPTQSEQRNHQSKRPKNPKVNNKDTKTPSMTSLWCINSKPKAYNTTLPSNTVTDSEQATARWYVSYYYPHNHHLHTPAIRMTLMLPII